MPAALALSVAPAPRAHYSLTNALRGRNRAASEVGLPPPREPERAQLTKAASYTYFPRVKDLDQDLPVDLTEDDLEKTRHGEGTSDSSSGGSSPSSEEAPEAAGLQMRPHLRPSNSRRSSRFLPFSSKSRDPSAEPKPDRKADRGRAEAVKQEAEPAGASPGRSLAKLRRKSWIVSQQHSSSPTRADKSAQKEDSAKKSQAATEANKRKTPTNTISIPEESEARDTVQEDLQQPIPLTKKNKRLSGLFNATTNSSPSVPKSFSTEQLPYYSQPHTPLSPTHIPPLPRNISAEKLKGVKTEPRKKDELWTVFRTLDADLRKHDSLAETSLIC